MDQLSFFTAGEEARRDWFAEVYQSVDAALDRGAANVPPGTLAALYRALDGLRDSHVCDRHVARAGAMVVTLHRLQAMLRDRSDALAVAELRRDLASMQREWLKTTPILH